MTVQNILSILRKDEKHEVYFQDEKENYVNDLSTCNFDSYCKLADREVIKIESFGENDLIVTVK